MIEVSAEVLRGPVFLAGEIVEASITFCCRSSAPNGLPDEGEETLALASVQINCVRVFLLDKKRATNTGNANTSMGTAFLSHRGEAGEVVFATSPKILFCDLTLRVGERKTCEETECLKLMKETIYLVETYYQRMHTYSELLPINIPPSYRGHSIKQSYKLVVGTQRPGQPIKVIRLPLRVLTLPPGSDSVTPVVAPANPFLGGFLGKAEPVLSLETALQVLQNISARRSPSVFVITHSRGHVARFCLYKSCYKLGEDIVGTFDFRRSYQIPCIQFLVTLQSLEIVRDQDPEKPSVTSYNNYHEDCMFRDSSHVVLPIPLHVTPSFKSDAVTLSWRLHFEFVLSTVPIPTFAAPRSDDLITGAAWEAPSQLDIETMIWDLPITLVPSSPLNIAQGLHLEPQTALVL
ncbi:unnamed protein product [Cyprideis torosa]|uniref:Uncharacterized protein n=1 Tax=Cyprideis torosa TaxID=163714 RepID=A0A7R8W0C0_9CRUS|nr:unnamed protein product [Cyprideis torosa]CAG0879399.1 unnamed protein product [Cyprideis torosa]